MYTANIYFILYLGFTSASSVTITEFLVPKFSLKGEDVELKCKYNLEEKESVLFYVKWWWTPLGSPLKRQQIYQRLRDREPQSSVKGIVIKDNDTIELSNVQPNNSGIYECEVSNIDEAHMGQELIVFTEGSGVLLNVTSVPNEEDHDESVFQCDAMGVAPEPALVIEVNGDEVTKDVVKVTGPDNGLYDISANITLKKVEDGDVISCSLRYAHSHQLFSTSSITFEKSGAELTTEGPYSTTELIPNTTETLEGSSISLSTSRLLVLLTTATFFYNFLRLL